jgi:hypothetical protein
MIPITSIMTNRNIEILHFIRGASSRTNIFIKFYARLKVLEGGKSKKSERKELHT